MRSLSVTGQLQTLHFLTRDIISKFCLSRFTFVRRIEELSNNVEESLEIKAAMDDSTDVSNSPTCC
jgi:hypothetical protein